MLERGRRCAGQNGFDALAQPFELIRIPDRDVGGVGYMEFVEYSTVPQSIGMSGQRFGVGICEGRGQILKQLRPIDAPGQYLRVAERIIHGEMRAGFFLQHAAQIQQQRRGEM